MSAGNRRLAPMLCQDRLSLGRNHIEPPNTLANIDVCPFAQPSAKNHRAKKEGQKTKNNQVRRNESRQTRAWHHHLPACLAV